MPQIETVSSPPTQEVVQPTAAPVAQQSVVRETSGEHMRHTFARVVWFVCGIIDVLLAFRIILEALAANPANGFAALIYNLSSPFAAPFYGLFAYQMSYRTARFDLYSLIAIAVYTLIAWGVVKLIYINDDSAGIGA